MNGKIKITSAEMRISNTRVADPVVHFEGRKLVADGNLPGQLARLVPPGWGNAPVAAWQPFVTLAVAMGRL